MTTTTDNGYREIKDDQENDSFIDSVEWHTPGQEVEGQHSVGSCGIIQRDRQDVAISPVDCRASADSSLIDAPYEVVYVAADGKANIRLRTRLNCLQGANSIP